MEFVAAWNALRDLEKEEWGPPEFRLLGSGYPDLGKLRFKANRTEHRPIGFFGPRSLNFTFLIWAIEKDRKYRPPNVRETAITRMKVVLADPTRAHEFHI